LADYLFMIDREAQQRGLPCRVTSGTNSDGYFFDGIGIFDGTLVASANKSPRVSVGNGCYLSSVHRADGSVTIAIDPLAMYPLFVHESERAFCVSNNIFLMVKNLRTVGIDIQKDLSLSAMFVSMGTGIFDATGYKNIKLLGLGATINVSASNDVEISTKRVRDQLYAERPSKELFDDAAHEILTNIRALATSGISNLRCDLTGGMDSRLVLAGILNQGLQGHFEFHTNYVYPNPDANVASLLRNEFGLRAGSPKTESQAELPLDEYMRRAMWRVNGLMEMFWGVSLNDRAHADTMRLGGGCGELTRDFYSTQKNIFGFIRPLKSQVEMIAKRGSALRSSTRKQFERYIRQFVSAQLAAGVAPAHVATAYYLTCRNRYHFGVVWRSDASHRFHPLYSPAAIKAAFAIPDEQRKINAVGFNLMKRLAPQLLDIPFAEKKWHPSLHPHAPDAIERSSPPLTPDQPTTGSDSAGKREGEKVAAYNRLYRAFLPIENASVDRLDSHYDVARVKEFFAHPVKDAFHAIRGNRLLGAYCWANDLELSPERSGAM
jgi:hypothetical protein